ncbi:SDR family oxidoreductase [Rubellimicrobium rubrum]|uniref:SDR family oxidoreductase n=1 Tax=Rubellimicrobium rubrum TaxID=2585369 RepID=A0A5C4MZT0_9RHOB|nr:SDR family oxidoreductase [Rubellimicrobium rubrum]TNC49435.1 SDR family oxidoreductase [Rubellimicrobium rubrum]
MIVVTGATGQLGRRIVEALAARVGAGRVVASARDPGKAQELAALGVEVRHGDYEDPDSLKGAFAGASQVLLVSSNARATGGDTLAQHRRAIEAAREAGVGRVVYTSHMAAGPGSQFPPARDHAATEAMLAESGLRWTALRHGFYGTSGLMMIQEGLGRGIVEAPADGPVSWTAHDDLAAADAAILAEEGRFDGPTPPLTGSEALDFAALAGIASDLLGRPVARTVIPDEDMPARLVARGLPPRAAEMIMGYFHAARAGEFATVDPALTALIGREPRPMREVMRERLMV